MKVNGTDRLQQELERRKYFFKAILNANGVAFFSGKTEHRTVKLAGLSYEDDYEGNALAAIITDGRFEIRDHRDFPPSRVKRIIKTMLKREDLQKLKDFSFQYRGKKL